MARRGRGEGSIEEMPDGRWRAVLSLGTDAAGKRVRKKIYGRTKTEVLKKLREFQARHNRGDTADAGRTTVGQWLTQWLAIRRPDVEPETYRWYERRARLHLVPTLGHLPLSKLTPLHVEQMHATLTERGVSRGEQFKAATTLRAALRHAVRLRLLSTSVAVEVTKPRTTAREMACLTADQARALIAAAADSAHRLAAYIPIALDTGCRPGELFALTWADVDFDGGTVTVRRTLEEIGGRLRIKEPKTTKSRRTIQLGQIATAALRELADQADQEGLCHPEAPVFASRKGNWQRRGAFSADVYRPILAAAGLPPIRPYDLRHTCATLLLAAGVNVKVVSERLGHESIEITLRHYAHCLPSMQAQAAAAWDAILSRPPNDPQPPPGESDRRP